MINNIKELQEVSLKMAIVFTEFCKKHHLLTYLCGGGCIGTLRHGGFIPWDDDLDFFMPREDYENFLSLWEEEVYSDRYHLSITDRENMDHNLFATIRDTHTTQVKPYQKDLNIPHGVALDIIPLDGYAPTKWKRILQCINAMIYSLFCSGLPPKKHGGLISFGSKLLLKMFTGKKIRYRIWKKAKRNMTKYSMKECEYTTELCSGPFYMKKKYRSEWFKSNTWKNFEFTTMPIPVGGHNYLTEAFGDYMELPPEDKRVPHHDSLFLDLNKGYEYYRGKEWMKS